MKRDEFTAYLLLLSWKQTAHDRWEITDMYPFHYIRVQFYGHKTHVEAARHWWRVRKTGKQSLEKGFFRQHDLAARYINQLYLETDND